MSFSYNEAETDNISRVRGELQDINSVASLFSDEVISAQLAATNDNPNLAAARLYRRLAQRVRQGYKSGSVGGLSYTNFDPAELERRAAELEGGEGGITGGVWDQLDQPFAWDSIP